MFKPCLLVILISGTQSLRSIIEGVSKRFVKAFEVVPSSHEHLQSDELKGHEWSAC